LLLFLQVVISDGDYYCNGMLATQLNNLVNAGQVKENSVIKITDFMNNVVQDRVVIIVLNLEVVGDHPGRIGAPMDISKTTIGQSAAAPEPAAQPMYNRTNLPTGANPYGAKATKQEPVSSNPYGNSRAVVAPTAPIVRSSPSTGVPITPISQLNMYQNRWTIRARVTTKSDIRSWSNARGEGTLFSVELLDSSGVDVKATFFKEAVDKFYGMLEANQVYTFSGGKLKVANTQYNTCKCAYEITFDQNSEIHLVDDTGEIQSQLFDFCKIADVEAIEQGKSVDILVIVKAVGEPTSLLSKKSGQELLKCDLTVVDDSGVEINLTVWGDKARQAPLEYGNHPVVAFRRVRVSDYGGKSVSTTTGGAAIVSPPVPEAMALQAWWQRGGATATRSLSSSTGGGKMDALADRKDIKAIKAEHLGQNEKPDWLSFKGTMTFLKKDKEGGSWYTACANSEEPCKNRFKVTQTTDMNWFCDKCQGTYPNCVRRWIFSGTVADDTSTTWVSFFNEQAETLLGAVTADQVYAEAFDNDTGGNQDLYDSYFAKANYTDWIFKCKVKREMMGDEARDKTSVYSLHPVNYAKESRDLLDAIAKF
jgi:replication factor A1